MPRRNLPGAWPTVGALLLLVLGCVPALQARPQRARCDVLLVDHPEKLSVLNQYEQTASQDDRKLLTSCAPLVVANEGATLSDGFTPCTEVRVGGVLFYLLKSEHGALPAAAGVRSIRGAIWIGDTMRVNGKGDLVIEDVGGKPRRVSSGSLLEVSFEDHGRFYVQPLTGAGSFGWIGRAQAERLGPVENTERPSVASDTTIAAVVRSKIDETNTVLRQLYSLFNRRTDRSLAVPVWTISVRPGLLRCELQNSRVSYEKSSRYLQNDLENALLGSGARIVESPGAIAVYLP